MQRVLRLFVALSVLGLVSSSAHAVKKFKVSNNGGGAQIWFEAEDFDARDSATSYQLLQAEAKLAVEAGVNGDALTNVTGAVTPPTAWVRYNFNVAAAGGKAGTWYFFGRIISPNNQSDWLWIKGQQGDVVPTTTFAAPDTALHRILEETVNPPWAWIGGKAKAEGHVRPLLDGDNVMVVFWRQSDNTNQWDTFVWANKEDYIPTDDDYKNAKAGGGTTAVDPKGKAATRWASLKAER